MDTKQALDSVTLEMRRGAIILAVLSQLQQEEYGYSLIKRLADHGMDIDQGTLYPLLRRLESQGWLESDWRVEDARPRRYYVLSPEGQSLLPALKEEWGSLARTLGRMVE